jgi:hypothetical protein
MSQPVPRRAGEHRIPLKDRIERELIEADVEMGFRLVDMAEDVAGDQDVAFAVQAAESAEEVCRDIEQRLARLTESAREPFVPLVEELLREIGSARSRR